MKLYVGAVRIIPAGRTNPYGSSLGGPERKAALKDFRDGRLPPSLAAWYAPLSGGGGPRQLTDPSEVDWESAGLAP